MPRFLSPEWVAAVNESMDGVDPRELVPADPGSLVAAGGRFRVTQVVRDPPPSVGTGSVRTTLVVEDGTVRFELEDPDIPPATAPDVVVVLAYQDAAALSRGELQPAQALGEGRVRVRGDLSVLMAGQALLQAAAGRLAAVHADTTY